MSWLFTLFLVAHALIHASFVSPRPPATAGGPEWPFDLAHSWLLSPVSLEGDTSRVLGIALIALVIVGFGLATLATLGVLGSATFGPGIVLGAVASLVLLGAFYHPWLTFGLVIDVVLVWAVTVAHWSPISST
jgi:hypothetical protein